MEIGLSMRFHPGHGDRPRPSLRITAKALRRGAGGSLEELIHTRLIDCPYPETLRQGLDVGLDKLQQLRHGRDWWAFDALGADPVRTTEIAIG